MKPLNADETEVVRIMEICNACRYCEGFCAVFPAMTRRLEFEKADTHYLANLCHGCNACLYACQYAEPHAFAVNVPKSMASVRAQTYHEYAWPAAFGSLYRRAGLTIALASGTVFAMLVALATRPLMRAPLAGNFYAILPHNVLAMLFGSVFIFSFFALMVGVRRFWREVTPAREEQERSDHCSRVGAVRGAAALEAAQNVLTLKYLGGGHEKGCNEDDDRFTLWRRRFHHLTFWGFMLCFASTSVASVYHYVLQREAPYPISALPVQLGIAGGIGLVLGPIGLLWLNIKRGSAVAEAAPRSMDRGFIALLLLTSATGLALLALRDTRLMAWLFTVHLGFVLALFLTLPYGKFAHGIFRTAALFKFAIEKRLPDRVRLDSG